MPTTYAVVGSSKGIGLEYIRQLSNRSNTLVFAIVRNKENSPQLLSHAGTTNNVHVIEADVTDYPSLERAAQEIEALSGGKLDNLIHNAARVNNALFTHGFKDYTNVGDLDEDFVDAFRVNALGAVHAIHAFLPLLRAGAAKKIAVIGSGRALYSLVRKANLKNTAAFGASRAASTMITTQYALELAEEGFTVVTLLPSPVDLGTRQAESADPEVLRRTLEDMARVKAAGVAKVELESVDLSVARQLKVIDGLTPADNGKILSHHGVEFSD